jgi:putative ABC transport system ATP-binding protein
MSRMLIETRALAKAYRTVRALNGVSVDIARGEFVAVMGPSGSGKSTFMNLLGCLDRPSAGSYRLDGVDVTALAEGALASLRKRRIGFVFQSFNLLARATALENVELPMLYDGRARRERLPRAGALLKAVGLGERMHHLPSELSGGEQQRVAIARALANRPALMLADEPTGALDSRTGTEIIDLLAELNRSGLTIIMVSHDETVARRASRVLRFLDGSLCDSAPARMPGAQSARPTLVAAGGSQ